MIPIPTWQHHVRVEHDRSVLTLSGEIDVNAAARLLDLLTATINTAELVEVDVHAVEFIDSTVISALITARNTATAVGRRLVLVNATGRVRRILQITGVLDSLLPGSS
ncbi:Anti-sigma-B factor antagonist [Micromonospora sp. MW-13]|uniref:STAS domain-containing protein n=1 Tax=unclassified Micromonospora TaxID=2617518 RepID=UPI000E44B80A|nr:MULTISPECIES: STAS domain-containing protein [unclassified Micromonospora]MCX4472482.1 STAS domain-containing protein [Micromonospora sp. NBC_01655]RGC69170.1 Anti-sigma-B factor antagonist [Micromonospora sp. MW-13]